MLVRVLQSDNAVKFGEALLGFLLLVTFSSSTQGMDLKTTFYRQKKKKVILPKFVNKTHR